MPRYYIRIPGDLLLSRKFLPVGVRYFKYSSRKYIVKTTKSTSTIELDYFKVIPKIESIFSQFLSMIFIKDVENVLYSRQF